MGSDQLSKGLIFVIIMQQGVDIGHIIWAILGIYNCSNIAARMGSGGLFQCK